jgi:hypothetical protein
MAANLQWHQVVFESDNFTLINACKEGHSLSQILFFVEDLKEWKKQFTEWEFTWTKREGNAAAHQLAQLRKGGPLPPNWTSFPPLSLGGILCRDSNQRA